MSAPSARANPQFQWDEHTASSGSSLGTFPYDCATSHNNNRAAVRYANPNSNVTIWNLTTAGVTPTPLLSIGGAPLRSGEGTMLGVSPFTNYQPSDRIDLTNSLGVSIGAGFSSSAPVIDETYIEVFDLAPPAFRYQYVEGLPVSDPDWVNKRAGFAHDVAITRDGDWAVVSSANWIHVLNLNFVPPDLRAVQRFDIGKSDYSNGSPVPWDRPCTPNRAVDSVVVTNDRAVVTTARLSTIASGYTTWVYVIDLTDPNMTGMAGIVLQHEILPPTGTTFPTEAGDWPHDLTATPYTDIEQSGEAVAVVTTNHTVAAYNLTTNSFLNSFYDEKSRRDYQWQVDSVEMTGKVAVAISDRFDAAATPPLRWQYEIFQVSGTTGLTSIATHKAPDGPADRAHDLAIAGDHGKGLVRTSLNNVVLTSFTSPVPPPLVLLSPNLSDAHAYDAYRSAWGYSVFSSDSVAIGTMQVDDGQNRLMAVSTGGILINPSVWKGAVDVIDLNAPTPSVLAQVPIAANNASRGGCVPLDLAIAFSQTEVIVRSADPLPETPTTSVGADLARIQILPAASIGLIHQYGGHGSTMGLDSLAIPSLSGFINTTRRILSIAQDEFSLPSGVDYIHIAR